MKMKKQIRLIKILSLALIFGVLYSCGNSNKSDSNNVDKTAVDTDKGTTNNSSKSVDNQSVLKIKTAGKDVGEIKLSANTINFEIEGTNYKGKIKGEKRKYKNESGIFLAEVKFKKDAFKLRTESAKLLWKIKIYDDKIKISDNEENKNPYQIKLSGDKAKVKKNDIEIGRIKLNKEKGVVEISSETMSFTIESDKIKLAYGVLLIDEIPLTNRYIIMAELLSLK